MHTGLIPILGAFTAAFFLFSGFLGLGMESAPKGSIAILPVEQATGRPLTVPVRKNLIEKFSDSHLAGKLSGLSLDSTHPARDPAYAAKQIYIYAARALKRKGWAIVDPVQAFGAFNVLAYVRAEVDFNQLKDRLPADLYLFIAVTYWDPDDFDADGEFEIGYRIQVIDRLGQLAWQKDEKRKKIRIRQNQNEITSYARRFYDELLRRISLDMLNGFPKALPARSVPQDPSQTP